MNLLLNVLASSLAVLVAARLLKGVTIDGFYTAVAVALTLGVINAVLGPLLLILTLPLNILTLGLFSFVIIAAMVRLAAAIVPGFRVENFWWALAFALVLAIVNAFLHSLANR